MNFESMKKLYWELLVNEKALLRALSQWKSSTGNFESMKKLYWELWVNEKALLWMKKLYWVNKKALLNFEEKALLNF